MDIWYSPYELRPLQPLNAWTPVKPRVGALLRVNGGYADLHPWPELGDKTLEEELRILAQGGRTALSQASLRFAEADAKARAQSVSLFEGLEIPSSHWISTDLASLPEADMLARNNFDRIKIKVGARPEREAAAIETYVQQLAGTAIKLRLDFNAKLDEASFVKFLSGLSVETLDAIDFIEDPFAYDGKVWARVSQQLGCRLALDRGPETAREGVEVFVIKPARQDEAARLKLAMDDMKRIVFTSNMDHPVGQVFAAWVAARAAKQHPLLVDTCGLITHTLYETTPFSQRLVTDGPRLTLQPGKGIGFDDLLDGLEWNKLA